MVTSVNSRRSDPKQEAREAWEELLERIEEKLERGEALSLHEFVVNALRTRGSLSLREIFEESGVPERTIEKIASGASPDPLVSNCEKLATYFRLRNRDKDKSAVRA